VQNAVACDRDDVQASKDRIAQMIQKIANEERNILRSIGHEQKICAASGTIQRRTITHKQALRDQRRICRRVGEYLAIDIFRVM
jgi:hypothetical protein